MKRHYIFIPFLIIILSCSKSKRFDSEDTSYSVSEKNLKNIKVISSSDQVPIKEDKIFFSYGTIFKPINKDRLLLIDNLDIYFLDTLFQVEKHINLSQYNYMIKKGLRCVESQNDMLFLLDNVGNLVSIQLNGEKILTINYVLRNKPLISDFKILNNDYLIISYIMLPDQYINSDKRKLGAIINSSNGKEEIQFISDKPTSDQVWSTLVDKSFVTYYKDYFYFGFLTSRNVYKYNGKGELVENKNLEVNYREWKKPKIASNTTHDFEGKKGYFQNSDIIIPILNNSLQIHDNKIFQLIYNGLDKTPSLNVYDLHIQKLTSISLTAIEGDVNYKLYFFKQYCLLVSDKYYLLSF